MPAGSRPSSACRSAARSGDAPNHGLDWYNRAVRFALCVLAGTLAVAVGAGCGGKKQAQAPATSSNRTTTTSPGVTRPKPGPNQSRWAKEVDVTCKPWQKRIDAVSPAPTDTASLRAWLERTLPLVRKQIAAVKAVKPPTKRAEARKVRLFIDAVEKTERALTRYLAAIKANAPAKVRTALADAGASGSAARTYAVSLGITQCGGYASG